MYQKFCHQVDSTGFDDKDLEVTFRFCYKEEIQKEGKAFTFIFYPAAILVSALFLLLTLIAYVIDPDLHKPLFGKITLGFVFNNLIAYLCLAFVYLGANYRYHDDGSNERFIYFTAYITDQFSASPPSPVSLSAISLSIPSQPSCSGSMPWPQTSSSSLARSCPCPAQKMTNISLHYTQFMPRFVYTSKVSYVQHISHLCRGCLSSSAPSWLSSRSSAPAT